MVLDKTILARAKGVLAEKKRRREEQLLRRQADVYQALPALAAMDVGLRELMTETFRVTLAGGGDVEKRILALGEESLKVQDNRRALLKEAGLPEDYLDDVPACPHCGDSGFRGSEPCSCLLELYRKEQAKELSILASLKEESFDTFQLFWYSDQPDDKGRTEREHMEVIYGLCRRYAETFGSSSGNLLFTGGPGLGKTFLSACIARGVSDKGFSVVYQTAGEVFRAFEAVRFGRGSREEAGEEALHRLMLCDLLILDDLGTEMTNALTVASLYELVNTRLQEKRKTIISTNLAPSELAGRYSPQIASRLIGEYEILTFTGKDIRLQKKNAR
ncbi:MAG: ATP-binding protein [Oscillospiraceae bacterium]|nr:ATP-binding protein [Oscillospiraceae bacterium]